MKMNKNLKKLIQVAMCNVFIISAIVNPQLPARANSTISNVPDSTQTQSGQASGPLGSTASTTNSSVIYDPSLSNIIGPLGSSNNADTSSSSEIDTDSFTANAGNSSPDAIDTDSFTSNAGNASPDASDYADTGGVAAGTMSIGTYIPSGCLPSLPQNVAEPIVQIKDKYSYEDMATDLETLSKKYPNYMSYTSIGTTADNRQIYEAIVGNSASDTQVLITGSIHGREYITTLLVMKQLEYILYYADTAAFDSRRISDWLKDVCIRFIPMVNPDGVSISQFGAGGIGSENLRNTIYLAYTNDYSSGRTRSDYATYLTRWKANANGVNLNENFAVATPSVGQSTSLPSSEEYYGTPGSEAETKALQNLVDNQHFEAVINYHATGSVIYWNYSGNPLVEHTRDLSNNVWALTGYTLLSTDNEGGSFKGYLGALQNPVTNLTVEVGRSRAPVNIREFGTIWNENLFVPFYTIKWAKEKGK